MIKRQVLGFRLLVTQINPLSSVNCLLLAKKSEIF